MKKLLLISFLVVLSVSLFAQQKGDFVVSGSLSWISKSSKLTYDSSSETYKGDREFRIIPEFNYFVADKFSVGLGIGYWLTKERNNNSVDEELFNKTGRFFIQPVAKYYVSLGEKFYYVPTFYIGFAVGKYKEELTDSKTEDMDLASFYTGLSLLSFEFKPTDRIGITFRTGDLSYQTDTYKVDSDNKLTDRNFGLELNLGASVGFNYYF